MDAAIDSMNDTKSMLGKNCRNSLNMNESQEYIQYLLYKAYVSFLPHKDIPNDTKHHS